MIRCQEAEEAEWVYLSEEGSVWLTLEANPTGCFIYWIILAIKEVVWAFGISPIFSLWLPLLHVGRYLSKSFTPVTTCMILQPCIGQWLPVFWEDQAAICKPNWRLHAGRPSTKEKLSRGARWMANRNKLSASTSKVVQVIRMTTMPEPYSLH